MNSMTSMLLYCNVAVMILFWRSQTVFYSKVSFLLTAIRRGSTSGMSAAIYPSTQLVV